MVDPPFDKGFRSAPACPPSCDGVDIACKHASCTKLFGTLLKGTADFPGLERKLTPPVLGVFLDTVAIFGADTPFDAARDETLARLNGVADPSRSFSKMEVTQLIENCHSIFAPGMRLRRVGLADQPAETLGVAENLLLRVDREQCILCGGNLPEESCVLANDELTGSWPWLLAPPSCLSLGLPRRHCSQRR